MTLSELQLTLSNLRQAWRGDWPGLPQIVQACANQLGLRAGRMNDRFHAIDRCLNTLSALMEQEGTELALTRQEPPYHNRLHTADTLVALTTLLLRSRDLDASRHPRRRELEWLGLLAMLGHDFRHPGQINRFPQQIESATVSYLRPIMTQCGVSLADQQEVADLILFTDPLQVPALHRKWRSSAFNLRQLECMAILLEEADILASCLPETGPALGESLKQEWQKAEFAAAKTVATPAGRQGFLQNVLFTSPASQDLGIAQQVANQTLAPERLKRSASVQTT